MEGKLRHKRRFVNACKYLKAKGTTATAVMKLAVGAVHAARPDGMSYQDLEDVINEQFFGGIDQEIAYGSEGPDEQKQSPSQNPLHGRK